MSSLLNFKYGQYKNIYTKTENTDPVLNEKIDNGTIGFATFESDETSGALVVKLNDNLYNIMPPSSNTLGQPLVSGGANKSSKYVDALNVLHGGTGLTENTIEANQLYYFQKDATSILNETMVPLKGSFIADYFLSINGMEPYIADCGIATDHLSTPYLTIHRDSFPSEDYEWYPSAMLGYSGDIDRYLDIPNIDGSLIATSYGTWKPSYNMSKQYDLAIFNPEDRGNVEALNSFYCDTIKTKDQAGKYTNYLNLTLGNNVASSTNQQRFSSTGAITLFAQNTFSTKILPRELITSRSYNLYLPDFVQEHSEDTTRQNLFLVGIKETPVTDATHITSNILLDVGSIDTPVYAKATGELIACNGVVMTAQNQEFTGVKTFSNVFTAHLRPKVVEGKAYELGGADNPWSVTYTKSLSVYGSCTIKNNDDSVEALVPGGGISVGSSVAAEVDSTSTSTTGSFTRLYLGNNIAGATYALNEETGEEEIVSTNTKSRYGELFLYTQGSGAIIVKPRKNSTKVNSNLNFYLPDPLEVSGNKVFATWTTQETKSLGDANHPVYMAKSGEILACSSSLGNSENPLSSITAKEFIVWDSHTNAQVRSGKLYTAINSDTDCKYTTLELGNEYAQTTTQEVLNYQSKQGQIRLFGKGTKSIYIRPRPEININSIFYLPTALEAYAVWYDNKQNGNSTTPIYIDQKGQIQVADGYETLFTELKTEENTITVEIGTVPKTANIITSFEGSWSVPTGGVNNPTISLEINGKTQVIDIPAASTDTSGIVTTAEQTFSGQKNFVNNIIPVLTTKDNNNIFSTISLGALTNYWDNIFIKNITLAASSDAKTVKIKNDHTNTTNGLNIHLPAQATVDEDKDDYDVQLIWKNYSGGDIGGNDTPVYITDNGYVATGSKYAGGTKINSFNGITTASDITSVYAPTASGTKGQVLLSDGTSKSPVWTDQNTLKVDQANKDGSGNPISSTYATKTELTQAINAITGDTGTDAFSTLVEIQQWMDGDGVDAKELTAAIAGEAKSREDADKGLQDQINGLSTRVTPISLGGTGTNALTSNRIIYANTDATGNQTFVSGNHYISSSKIAINYTSEPTEDFYVSGVSKFNGKIIGASGVVYGSSDPSNLSNPSEGQIYFKLI